jgi:signal transduction histidine kinase
MFKRAEQKKRIISIGPFPAQQEWYIIAAAEIPSGLPADRAPPEASGTREVRELGAAFGQMLDNLEHSRQQVIHAAKLAVVGEMAAIMAHEVRTPLGILHTSARPRPARKTSASSGCSAPKIRSFPATRSC